MIITQRSILWTAGRLPRKRCSESHSLPLALAPAAPMPQRSTPPAGGRTACQAKRSLALVKTLFGCLWRYGHAVGGQRSRMCFWRHGQGESQQLMRVGSAYCEAPRAFSAKMSTPGSGRCVNEKSTPSSGLASKLGRKRRGVCPRTRCRIPMHGQTDVWMTHSSRPIQLPPRALTASLL